MRRVSAARLAAYDVLRDVDELDAYANLALPHKIKKSALSDLDAAFVTELVSQTLRLRGRYEAIISAASARPAAELDARTRRVLLLGAHQILGMRVALHAAINESVELQKLVANKKAAGFVNAVLRNISRKPLDVWLREIAADLENDNTLLAFAHSHPEWIVRSLADSLKNDNRHGELAQLLEADNIAPKVNIAFLNAAHRDIFKDKNEQQKIPASVEFVGISPVGAQIKARNPGVLLRQLQSAGITARVQDQGSQLAALALSRCKDITAAEQWLDLCAGPGGKTALLAAEAQRATFTVNLRANEIAAHRARLVTAAVADYPEIAQVVSFDGTTEKAFAGQKYDRILVDAPCSGLGALRRRPEARWRKKPQDIAELVSLQEKLLAQAVKHLKAGGVLAYVTCSPHLAETKAVVERLKRTQPVAPVSTGSVLNRICDSQEFDENAQSVQLWPHIHGTDAMFIALFTKI